jgi:hypothetical protein
MIASKTRNKLKTIKKTLSKLEWEDLTKHNIESKSYKTTKQT